MLERLPLIVPLRYRSEAKSRLRDSCRLMDEEIAEETEVQSQNPLRYLCSLLFKSYASSPFLVALTTTHFALVSQRSS